MASKNPKKNFDLIGQRFGRLTVIKKLPLRKSKNVMWECLCDCGNTHKVATTHLRKGAIESCGCLLSEVRARGTRRKHGHAIKNNRSKAYRTWSNMIDRCENSNNNSYRNYGERGIKVCDRWRNSFENFLADMGEPLSINYSIDRINVNGDYEPKNCQWIPIAEQTKNQRRNVFLTHQGQTMLLADWAKKTGIDRRTISHRLKEGWSVEDALSTPIGTRNKRYKKITYQGKTQCISSWAREFGLHPDTLRWRLKQGWSIQDALITPTLTDS